MKINDKKGVSTIVTVVLLILVAITAVALIAAFVIPFIKGSLGESKECFAVLGKVDVVPGQYTCYNATQQNVTVRIKRGYASDVTIDAISVVLSGGGRSSKYDVKAGTSPGVWMYGGGATLSLPGEGEEVTYVFDATKLGAGTTVTKVEVAPVLSSDKVCEAAAADIPACT